MMMIEKRKIISRKGGKGAESCAVNIPKKFCEELGLASGEWVDIDLDVQVQMIRIRKSK